MRRAAALPALLAVAAAAAGCGVGAGAGTPDVSLLVTGDRGARLLGHASATETKGSETVMRLLQRHFRVTTRYGGGFVQSIDGLAGGMVGGRPVDWFYYVNGVEADRGAAAARLRAGDRIWWDRHAWDAAQRTPAVVGAYPEPFLHGDGTHRWPTRVQCAAGADRACATVLERLRAAGARPVRSAPGVARATLRVLVGPWRALRRDRAGRLLDGGPAASGVFARFTADGRALRLLDDRGRTVRTVGAGAGLVAATRVGAQPPTWLVTGTGADGVWAAARALDATALGRRFALGVAGTARIALPVRGPGR